MKRYFAYNGVVALAFLLLWATLVIVEVKMGTVGFLKLIYVGSLPCVFICCFLAGRHALTPSRHPVGFAILSALIISPLLIFLGGALVTNFKFMIGGHL
jgi:hypothetical protein